MFKPTDFFWLRGMTSNRDWVEKLNAEQKASLQSITDAMEDQGGELTDAQRDALLTLLDTTVPGLSAALETLRTASANVAVGRVLAEMTVDPRLNHIGKAQSSRNFHYVAPASVQAFNVAHTNITGAAYSLTNAGGASAHGAWGDRIRVLVAGPVYNDVQSLIRDNVMVALSDANDNILAVAPFTGDVGLPNARTLTVAKEPALRARIARLAKSTVNGTLSFAYADLRGTFLGSYAHNRAARASDRGFAASMPWKIRLIKDSRLTEAYFQDFFSGGPLRGPTAGEAAALASAAGVSGLANYERLMMSSEQPLNSTYWGSNLLTGGPLDRTASTPERGALTIRVNNDNPILMYVRAQRVSQAGTDNILAHRKFFPIVPTPQQTRFADNSFDWRSYANAYMRFSLRDQADTDHLIQLRVDTCVETRISEVRFPAWVGVSYQRGWTGNFENVPPTIPASGSQDDASAFGFGPE